jgi:hypothetical protein
MKQITSFLDGIDCLDEVKRSIFVIHQTNFIGSNPENIESVVIDNGLFIGGKHTDGFMVRDFEDLVHAMYLTIIGEFEPPKPFTRKISELYKKASLIYGKSPKNPTEG